MGSVLARLLLFMSAYSPLVLVFVALYFRTNHKIAISILALEILGLFGLQQYLSSVQKLAAIRVTVESVQHRGIEVVRNILSYLVPFVALTFADSIRTVSLGFMLMVVGALYIKLNIIQVNPVLNFCGFRMYDIKIQNGGTHSLIARKRIGRGDSLFVVKVGDDLLMEKKKQ